MYFGIPPSTVCVPQVTIGRDTIADQPLEFLDLRETSLRVSRPDHLFADPDFENTA